MDLNIDLFTEIIKYYKSYTIQTLLLCCIQYNEYKFNSALLKRTKKYEAHRKLQLIMRLKNEHTNVLE
jgi:hypothetical protein